MRLLSRHPLLGRYLAALLLFAFAVAVFFHELVLHPGSRIACCTADGTSTLRDYWAASVQHSNPFSFSFDALDGAPQGLVRTPATVLANGGLQTAFVWWLRGPLGAVAAWNLFLFLGVIATAIATFALLDRLGCSFTASLFGAYVFAFSPYAFERAYAGHLGLLQNWVLVLVVGGLLRLRERRSLARAAAVGAALALAFYVSAYQGLLAGFAAFVFLAVELVRLRGRREWLRSALLGAAVYLVAVLALLPILILYARERSSVRAEVSHRVGEIANLSAKTTAYLLPSPRNPLFHWLAGFHPLDLTEQTLFFGYTTVALALAAVVLLRRGDPWLRASERRYWTAVFAAVLVPAAVLLSLPPSHRIGPLSIAMPSALLRAFSTYYRVYSRFGLLFGLGLVILAALALTALARRPARRWRYLPPLALLLVVLELLPGNLKAFDTSARPEWVAWLAAQPRGIVATYPATDLALTTADEWYQSLDGQPRFAIVGAGDAGALSRNEAIRLLAQDFGDPLTPRILATEDVRYVVVHDDVYRADGGRAPTLSGRYFTLLKRFAGVRVFSVHAPRVGITGALEASRYLLAARQGLTPPSLGFEGGFNPPERYFQALSRWMIDGGEIEVENTNAAVEVELTGAAFSNQQPRLLELLGSGGRVLGRELIPTHQLALQLGPVRSLPSGTLLALRPGRLPRADPARAVRSEAGERVPDRSRVATAYRLSLAVGRRRERSRPAPLG